MRSAAEGSVLKLLPAGPSGTPGPHGLECGFTTGKEARKCRSKRCGWKKERGGKISGKEEEVTATQQRGKAEKEEK